MKNINFMLKVTDAKKAEVRKALKEAGIKVRSLSEAYSEEIDNDSENKEDAGKQQNG